MLAPICSVYVFIWFCFAVNGFILMYAYIKADDSHLIYVYTYYHLIYTSQNLFYREYKFHVFCNFHTKILQSFSGRTMRNQWFSFRFCKDGATITRQWTTSLTFFLLNLTLQFTSWICVCHHRWLIMTQNLRQYFTSHRYYLQPSPSASLNSHQTVSHPLRCN